MKKNVIINTLIFMIFFNQSFSQINILPNGNFESGGNPSCSYNFDDDYEISNWRFTIGSFDWWDWDFRKNNCTISTIPAPNNKTSNRCVGISGDKSYSYNSSTSSYNSNIVNESIMVQLDHKLKKKRLYTLKLKAAVVPISSYHTI